ncbi:MAG: polyhydroxybutyrate depolymerase [Pseudomonadota bacterium]
MRFVLAFWAAVSFATTTQACGDQDNACKVESGVYYIAKPDGVENPPALLFLHGWAGSGRGQIRNRAIISAAHAAGYALIAPQGSRIKSRKRGHYWNAGGYSGPTLRDDLAYLSRVADDAAKRFGLDRSRMVLGGFSGGGMMTWRAACNVPEAFHAFAPIAGLLWRPLPKTCAGPVRMRHVHGWTDRIVPIEGRSIGRLEQGDLFQGLAMLRRTNGCSANNPGEVLSEEDKLVRRWSNCQPGSYLELVIHAGAHSVPKGWTSRTLHWANSLPLHSAPPEG